MGAESHLPELRRPDRRRAGPPCCQPRRVLGLLPALVEAPFFADTDHLVGDLVRVYEAGDDDIRTRDRVAQLQPVHGRARDDDELSPTDCSNCSTMATGRDLGDKALTRRVDEVLRASPPIVAWRRRVTPDGPGRAEWLFPRGPTSCWSSGRRTATRASSTTRRPVDVRRANAGDHLAFGYGIHYCLGAPLARLEARVVLEELTARLPGRGLGRRPEFTFADHLRGPGASGSVGRLRRPMCSALRGVPGGRHRRVGGKCALGAMLEAGLPVPPGFAVTTAAFPSYSRPTASSRRFMRTSSASTRGHRRPHALRAGAAGGSRRCRSRRRERSDPRRLRRARRGSGVPDVPVAVRSARPPKIFPTPASPASRTRTCG